MPLLGVVDMIDAPGAYTSTHAPVLDVVARLSSRVEPATTVTPGTARGSAAQSSAPVLPADAATNTPPSTSDRTAAASASDRP